MIEKILKETYATPKVELTQNDYNRLVSLATMKAKTIDHKRGCISSDQDYRL